MIPSAPNGARYCARLARAGVLALNDLPGRTLVLDAVAIYLQHAYPEGGVPAGVRARVERIAARPDDASFYASELFEHDDATPPRQYRLRLGNGKYPHMKLVIERAENGRGYVFAADTHDRHFVVPPGSADEEKLKTLREQNAAIVGAIDAEWQRAGIPTFKAYLRDDLERRRAAAPRPRE